MKRADFIWLAPLLALLAFMLAPLTQPIFNNLTANYPYLMGFVKFAILATMGELLALRIALGHYQKPPKLLWRIVIWGVIGVVISLMFKVFAGGVQYAMQHGYLPFDGNQLAFAFFTSLLMNLFFAPTFMLFHKHSDTYLELAASGQKADLAAVIAAIDWQHYISFVVLKTIPFFWIPAHTITFLLPAQYRVVVAAFLSIALGLILSLAKRADRAKE